MELHSLSNVDFTRKRWVDQIRKNFNEEAGIDVSNIPVCVFNVPKSISRFKPEAYLPQAIALGPYHHFEGHLYQMERYKVAVVKAFLDPYQVHSFEPLVIDKLKKIEPMIRACYHKYLDLNGDTLAWVFAIDGLFLLDLFKHYDEMERFMPKKLMKYETIYRDMMVLENQIPLVILNEIQKLIDCDFELLSMMVGYCEVHSPLKLTPDSKSYIGAANYLHLLDLMYRLIVNNELPTQDCEDESYHGQRANKKREITKRDHVITNMEDIKEIGQRLSNFRRFGNVISVMVNIPWGRLCALLGFNKKLDKEDMNDHPRVMEIDIPSVSSLSKYAHINFNPSDGGIKDTKFVATEAMLYLPVITLKIYSEVVLRNLVAYEIAISSSTMEIAQYVDLMSGIIDTEEDVKLLKSKGIIKGNMTNKEIVDLFNGMNKSCEHAARSNETVKQLNEYYNAKLAIKAWKFVKKRMRGSRKVLTVVFTLLACLLLIVYSFCEVYGCPKLYNKMK
ncbi:hypothetical protein QVD17_03219 [Tagetes erecta]|uniref:Uncharacterized protein n=1 Tax=Tagetes erecta TaxID=13708 RepID=A0AAD8LAK5_TARER|nr:hypothetical protein QVD17_03219 [Tagetes erecta]